MKLLLDANLSPRLVEPLRAAGYEVTHVTHEELLTAEDDAIFEWAADHDHVVVTADSDFGMLLALRRTSSPSVVHLRGVADHTPDVHAALLVDNLASIHDALLRGAIVSLSQDRLRIRDLPIE